MSDETKAPRRRGGRPATGSLYPHKAFTYLDDETQRLLELLAEKRVGGSRRGAAASLREGLRALAKQEGIR